MGTDFPQMGTDGKIHREEGKSAKEDDPSPTDQNDNDTPSGCDEDEKHCWVLFLIIGSLTGRMEMFFFFSDTFRVLPFFAVNSLTLGTFLPAWRLCTYIVNI